MAVISVKKKMQIARATTVIGAAPAVARPLVAFCQAAASVVVRMWTPIMWGIPSAVNAGVVARERVKRTRKRPDSRKARAKGRAGVAMLPVAAAKGVQCQPCKAMGRPVRRAGDVGNRQARRLVTLQG